MVGGSDKLFEKYLGLDSEATENTVGQTFQQQEAKTSQPRLSTINSLTEQFGNESQISHMANMLEENSMRVIADSVLPED